MILPGFQSLPVPTPDLGALKNTLDYSSDSNPPTGRPHTEAMLFGLGGGVGIIYLTLTFGSRSTMYIGTRHVRKDGDPTYPGSRPRAELVPVLSSKRQRTSSTSRRLWKTHPSAS